MLNFKLGELRRKNGLTQQELGDILGVSYQTISKWENKVVYPDISMLPSISSYFGVSVDALLGLVPLEQGYEPSRAGTANYWEKRLEYLKMTRKTMWNEDYFCFLVREVWNIDRPVSVLDCGCGYGAVGLMLMPLLPEGSRYTGIDFAANLLEDAKMNFRNSGMDAAFVLTNILEYEPDVKYDIVISQAVLRHVDQGERFVDKMVSFLKPGGLLVSMECNREFEADGLYVNGMDYHRLCSHEGLRNVWKTELEMQKRDYSIAMKIPHYMKAAGLREVECRMNDKVQFLEPEQPDYEAHLGSLVQSGHWDEELGDQEIEELIANFMKRGMSRKEAEEYVRQQNGIAKHMKKHPGDVALTKFMGLMISYGWKHK